MDDQDQLRILQDEINKKAVEYYKIKHKSHEFMPGISSVPVNEGCLMKAKF